MIGERKQIRLEKWASTADGNGEFDETIVQRVNTYAEVKRLSGSAVYLNSQVGLDNLFQFRLRFNSFDPTGDWRITFDRRIFTVHSIEKENQNRFYWIIKAQAKGER
jgi:SPP1 family predicted phage head-tail adaptor